MARAKPGQQVLRLYLDLFWFFRKGAAVRFVCSRHLFRAAAVYSCKALGEETRLLEVEER